MIKAVSHSTWQSLRVLVRMKHSRGKNLRMNKHRSTKNGEFLVDMMKSGFIKKASVSEKTKLHTDPEKRTDQLFNVIVFQLTPLGEYIAEYGEADYDFSTKKWKIPEEPKVETTKTE